MDDYRYTIRCIHYNINSAETEAPMREFFLPGCPSVPNKAGREDGVEIADLIGRERIAGYVQLAEIAQRIERHDIGDKVVGKIQRRQVLQSGKPRHVRDAVVAEVQGGEGPAAFGILKGVDAGDGIAAEIGRDQVAQLHKE